MTKFQHSLSSYNTFGFPIKAKKIVHINTIDDLKQVLRKEKQPFRVIGSGSNILFTKPINYTLLHNQINYIRDDKIEENKAVFEVGGGVLWHDWVTYCVERGWQGIENLAFIPGTVGAAPIQNIGAYGIEQQEAFVSLKAIHLLTGEEWIFTKEECHFGYRDSVFKQSLKGQYFVVSVCYRLEKKGKPNIDYHALEKVLKDKNITHPTLKEVYNVVIEIRKSKLPDPQVIGNAGSFFKNPIISKEIYHQLCSEYPNLPGYEASNNQIKIPAAYLIEQCGWKGYKKNAVGVYPKQALILVNYGGASGEDILALSQEIQSSIAHKFGIKIEPEVNIW